MSSEKLQRFRDGADPTTQAQVQLEASQSLARQGQGRAARRLLHAAIEAEPDNVEAWLRLAWLTEDLAERKALLQRVLRLAPDHAQARAELARIESASGTRPRPRRGWRWLLAGLVLLAALGLGAILIWGPVKVSAELAEASSLAWLMATPAPTSTPAPTHTPDEIAAQFAPQLEAALATENWERALEIVAIMQGVAPGSPDVQAWALAAQMQIGQALVAGGQPAEAQAHFDQAVALAPGDDEANLWQQTTRTYLAGQAALDAGDWTAAIDAFTQAHDALPAYGDVLAQLVEAYQRQGQAALDAGDWTAAIEALLQAHERAPDDAGVTGLLSRAYRGQGQAALDAEDWTAAVDALAEAHERLPQDAEIAGLLATAYTRRGAVRWEKGQLQKARTDLETALDLRPGDAEAQKYLDKVMYELFPPKRIEINISQQRFYAWEGDVLVYNFVTSTGLPGRDTAAGHYRVLDKIPMAYSSVWRLQMPYWLGIYYVANIENGIHALPIRPDGSVMWGGLLGQRASYGCIILSTEAARLIYNWADIGTPVDIHY
jgi:tetratricopeptide (TPR) repeat protein